MKTNEVVKRLSKELGFPVSDDAIFFYERQGLVPITRNPKNKYRDYTEKEYVRLGKIFRLSYLGTNLMAIKYLLNVNDIDAKKKWVKLKGTAFRVLKETL